MDFYVNHLKSVLLPFWLCKSIDYEYGGYYTCFSNTGEELLSEDKYTWSQGRMVWVFSKLSEMSCFTNEERIKFLVYAKNGADFLMLHCIMDNGNCTFLMDREGNPKYQDQAMEYDTSIYADCFVVLGISKYFAVSGDRNAMRFSQELYNSIISRLSKENLKTKPYPIPTGYKAHGIPMIMLCISQELALGLKKEENQSFVNVNAYADQCMNEIMNTFVGPSYLLFEMIETEGNKKSNHLYNRYINPGHTIEDMWFVIHQTQMNGNQIILEKAGQVVKKAFEVGWDKEYGGLLLFADSEGGMPQGETKGYENDEMVRKIREDWSNKLWWVHSEALYTSLLLYLTTKDDAYLDMYNKTFAYTINTFPNPDVDIGEWIQIRNQKGIPIQKTIALPVKDPFHIIRNFALIIELLQKEVNSI